MTTIPPDANPVLSPPKEVIDAGKWPVTRMVSRPSVQIINGELVAVMALTPAN